LNCCGKPAANFADLNKPGQLFQKTSVCCVYSQTGRLQEVLDVMVVAEENEQVVWQGLLRQGWGVCLSLHGCDLCLGPMSLDTNMNVSICAYLLCSI